MEIGGCPPCLLVSRRAQLQRASRIYPRHARHIQEEFYRLLIEKRSGEVGILYSLLVEVDLPGRMPQHEICHPVERAEIAIEQEYSPIKAELARGELPSIQVVRRGGYRVGRGQHHEVVPPPHRVVEKLE